MNSEIINELRCTDCAESLKKVKLEWIISDQDFEVDPDSEAVVLFLTHHLEFRKGEGHNQADILNVNNESLEYLQVSRLKDSNFLLGRLSGSFHDQPLIWRNPLAESTHDHD